MASGRAVDTQPGPNATDRKAVLRYTPVGGESDMSLGVTGVGGVVVVGGWLVRWSRE